MDDRYSRYGRDDRGAGDYGRDYGSGRDYSYSSAREYAAAGADRHERERGDWGGRGYGDDWSARGYRDDGDRRRGYAYGGGRGDWNRDRGYGDGWDRSRSRGYGGGGGYGRDRDEIRTRDWDRDRGFFDRAGDEVRSWFGDDEAERRRELDQRYDDRMGREERGRDDHYQAWRRQRIAELDRDYDEYRRENAQRFHNEFTSWRTERQGQRDCLSRVTEHMEVVGSDGSHVGTVDKVRGDRILLTKSDKDAGGHHHSIPSRWIDSVDDKVKLRKTAEEAKAHWKDEERSGAFFGDERDGGRDRDREGAWRSDHNLDRSFSGTY